MVANTREYAADSVFAARTPSSITLARLRIAAIGTDSVQTSAFPSRAKQTDFQATFTEMLRSAPTFPVQKSLGIIIESRFLVACRSAKATIAREPKHHIRSQKNSDRGDDSTKRETTILHKTPTCSYTTAMQHYYSTTVYVSSIKMRLRHSAHPDGM